MKKILLASSLALLSSASAETFTSAIHSLEKDFIRLSDGRVVFLSGRSEKAFIPNSGRVQIEIDDEANLKSIRRLELGPDGSDNMESPPVEAEVPVYTPTVLGSLEDVTAIWKRMNPYFTRDSECSNRAHVWAGDEFKRTGLKSFKQFVFFTASYINRNRFKWWFHVAPMVYVSVNGKVEERVLDFRYTHHPTTVKEWTDTFVFSKRPCRVTTRFSEYDVNPQTEDCYQMVAPMYYWMPADLSAEERRGIYKTQWSQGELASAFRTAFERGVP
jgi:hypothetical protein